MKRNTLLKSICVLSSLAFLLSVSFATNAQRRDQDDRYRRDDGRWERLGDARVDGNRDHDTITVNARGGFQAIRFFVQGGDIEVQRVVVHFENGADTEIEVQDRMRNGRTTRAYDLPGDERRIRSVEFWYSKGNWNRNKPQLVLYANAQMGGRDDRNQRNDRDDRYRRDDGRWERLGDARVDGNRDHDTITVNARGGFQAIRFFVQGGDIEVQRVVVHFENGADTEIEVQDRMRNGRTTRAYDLPGDERRIRSVEFWYSKGNWNRNKPQLVLYGRR